MLFIMRKNSEVRVLTIEEVIKATQPDVYARLQNDTKHSKNKNEKITKQSIKELMSHSYYKRGSGGAIRQVR